MEDRPNCHEENLIRRPFPRACFASQDACLAPLALDVLQCRNARCCCAISHFHSVVLLEHILAHRGQAILLVLLLGHGLQRHIRERNRLVQARVLQCDKEQLQDMDSDRGRNHLALRMQ